MKTTLVWFCELVYNFLLGIKNWGWSNEVEIVIESWRKHYNGRRPHRSLGGQDVCTPGENHARFKAFWPRDCGCFFKVQEQFEAIVRMNPSGK